MILQFLSEYAVLIDYQCLEPGFDIWTLFYIKISTTIVGGLTLGSLLVALMEKWLRGMSYSMALLYIFVSYTIAIVIVVFGGVGYWQTQVYGEGLFHPDVLHQVLLYYVDIDFFKNYFLWLFVILGTLIIMLVNDKYGPGIFKEFLLGKYFTPKREERIFMFLDLRASTRIAEEIGEEKFFHFVRDFISDATQSIMKTKGQIYQYVGDEIVVSWRMDKGVENANCIDCFFKVKEKIHERKDYYLEKYGLVPDFKAGIHYGYVMAGEMGVVKKDIVFSGDVLNTAARIQSKCNELGVNILFSKFLLDRIGLKMGKFSAKRIGNIDLKGKSESVELYTI